jgi:hypothetical protein
MYFQRLHNWRCAWICAVLMVLFGCSSDVGVDHAAYVCDPGVPGQCGSGYECQPVPGESFSACSKTTEDAPDATVEDADTRARDVSDVSDVSDGSTAPDATGDVTVPEDDAADTPGCTQTCTPGETTCQNGSPHRCEEVNDCPEWTNLGACDSPRVCEGGDCVCPDTCTTGQTRCLSDHQEVCAEDPTTSCPTWTFDRACSAEESCNGEACACTQSCSIGAKRCFGDTAQECVFGSGNCPEWVELTDCASIDQACISGECVDCHECPEVGKQQCDQDDIWQCITGNDGCRGWVNYTNGGCPTDYCAASSRCSNGTTGCADCNGCMYCTQ